MKEGRGRVCERDPRTARSHLLGMKVAPVCSVVETSRKKHLVGKRRCNFPRFFVPTLQYSSYLECFGERRYVFPRFFVPTLRYSGDLKHFGERRYECDGVFVPTLLPTLLPGLVYRCAVCRCGCVFVRYVGMQCRGRRCYSMRCAVILFYGMCGVVLGSCGISVVCPWGEGGSQCAVVGNFPEGGWGE